MSLDEFLISTVSPLHSLEDLAVPERGAPPTRKTVAPRRVHVPRSTLHQGPYGRVFPHLDPWEPRELTKADGHRHQGQPISEDQPDPGYPGEILRLADHSFPGPVSRKKRLNKLIPAGYTLLGQFIAHDLTFDPTTIHQRQLDPERLVNFRTPKLDLDSVYGGGPEASPYLYSTARGHRLEFVLGTTECGGHHDLPRNCEGQAIIPEPRNDSSLLISQTHLAFMQFHNAQMRAIRRDHMTAQEAFTRAQESTRWHYQWLVIEDWLGHLCGTFGDPKRRRRKSFNPHAIRKRLTSRGARIDSRGPLGFFRWKVNPYLPIEFAAAIGRVGHAMITDNYDLNGGDLRPLSTLRSHRRLLSTECIDWDRFVNPHWGRGSAQSSGRLEIILSAEVKALTEGRGMRNLAARDLIRSYQLGIPSGQAVERALGIRERNRHASTPLWYQLLSRSDRRVHFSSEGRFGRGQAVSRAASGLLCEVLFGLLLADKDSFLRKHPKWQPTTYSGGDYWGFHDFVTTSARV